jgi:protein subunit release factor A
MGEREMKETIRVEIRAAEGGTDSKLLVQDQYDIYRHYADLERL